MKILSKKSVYLIIYLFTFGACSEEIVYPEGGYEYPKYVEIKDTTFYCYPLKDIKSTRDSFETAYSYCFLKSFNEFNLSIKPKNKTTFRLIYACVMGPSSIIELNPDEITIKTQLKGWTDPYHDTIKLTEKERIHFQLLNSWFPLNDTNHKKWRKIYLDSMTRVYPQLLDASYYRYLLDKSSDYGSEKFTYSLKRMPISKKTFTHIVSSLNKSGYWQLPYEVKCVEMPTDGCTYILEANTPSKYNIVRRVDCPYDTSEYVKACQELVTQARMEKEINLVWNFKKYPRDYVSPENIKVRELQLQELKPEPKSKKKKAK